MPVGSLEQAGIDGSRMDGASHNRTTPFAGRSVPRPLSLKHRKLRLGLPPTLQRQAALMSRTEREAAHSASSASNERRLVPLTSGPRPPSLAAKAVPSTPEVADSLILPGDAACSVVEIESKVPVEPNRFILHGDYWQIVYQGSSALVDNSRGIRYIALLLQHSLVVEGPLHATELVALATNKAPALMELAIKDAVVDVRAEQNMIKRLEEIAFQRNTAAAHDDYAVVASLDEEADRITDVLASARTPQAGKGGRATFTDGAEKARKAVSKAIAEAISKLALIPNMNALADHLLKAIRKGQWLSYTGDLAWEIDFRPNHSEKKYPLRRAK